MCAASGGGTDPTPNAICGNPINAATGNKFQIERDFVGAGSTGLSFTRTYNSHATDSTGIGARWRSEWHSSLSVSGNTVTVTRADGRQDAFANNSGVYTADPDVRSVLRQIPASGTPTAYKLTTESDTIETYSPAGLLLSVTTRAGLVTTLTYDAAKNLTRVTGPFGHALTFTYAAAPDGNPRIARMTAPDGGVYRYGYDAFGNLRFVIYPDAKVRRYVYENTSYPNFLTGIIDEKNVRYATWAYDNLGRAISSQHAGGVDLTTVSYAANASTVTDARGNSATYNLATQFNVIKPVGLTGAPLPSLGGNAFTYDANGFLASKTDYDGNVTTYAHDARGNQTSRVEASSTPLARTITTAWHPAFHLPTRITEPGRVTSFAYDARGNLLTKTMAWGTLTRRYSYTYNASGQALTATDPLGHVTTYAYDAQGNLASVTNALGQATSFTNYDGAGRLLRAVDPNGVVTTLAYDPRGRVTSRTEATLTTSYAYDAAGNLITLTPPDGSALSFTYDGAHRLTRIADALGNRIVYTYDAASNRTKEQALDPANVLKRARSYAYDSVNRLSQIINAQGQKTNFAYDNQGNLTSVADPLTHATSYAYDALNRLAQSIDPNGGTTSLAYDALDHLRLLTDPRGLKTAYGWDALDDQKAVSSPDTQLTTRTFDAAGNVLTSTDARGMTTSYAYDALNRKTNATFADGTSVAYQYDQGTNGIGRLTTITDATGSTSYSYDANGHVTRKTQVIGTLTRVTSYAYDAGGRLASITYPSGKQVTYAYDAAGRVASLTAGAQTLVSGVTWQPFGGVTGWTFGNGASYARTFDLNGRITGLALPASNNLALAYDAANRITGITDSALPSKTFGYDALDRLTNYAGGALLQSYGYDADGNRTSASLKNGATTNAFTYAYPASRNRLASISGAWSESFTYDAAGNTLTHNSAGNYSFAYDARGRMAQATLGALTKTYGINGLGQRALKIDAANTSNRLIFVYDEAGHLIGEYGPLGAAAEETVWLGDLPVATMQGGAIFYIAPDHLGAPHQITNAAQAVVWRWDHDPFGNGAPTGSLTYNLRFPGQYFDAETGLNYNYFRDYDPKLGRYVQSDPIGLAGGVNTYAYVGANPVWAVDPYGLVAGPDEVCEAEGRCWPSRLGGGGGITTANLGPATGLPKGQPIEASGQCATVYRQGTFPNPGMGWSGNNIYGQQWAGENPLTAHNYAQRYGLPAENSGSPDWVIKGNISGGYTTRPAPQSHNSPFNGGGGQEFLPGNPYNVRLQWFHMPDTP